MIKRQYVCRQVAFMHDGDDSRVSRPTLEWLKRCHQYGRTITIYHPEDRLAYTGKVEEVVQPPGHITAWVTLEGCPPINIFVN